MKVFNLSEVGVVLQKMADSEINFSIEQFFDQGFTSFTGDKLNNDIEEAHADPVLEPRIISDSVSALAHHASFRYPKSEFAKWYRGHGNTDAPDSPTA